MNTRRWKYVMIEHPSFDGILVPVVFPEALEHQFVAKLGREGKASSAGFCIVDAVTGETRAYGESVSLGIKSNPERDAKLLRMWFIGSQAAAVPA